MKSVGSFIVFVLAMLFVTQVLADGPEFSGDCNKISWGPSQYAESYNVYINDALVANIANQEILCSEVSIPIGQNNVQVSGVNIAGEGPRTPPFPFVVLPPLPGPIQDLGVQ